MFFVFYSYVHIKCNADQALILNTETNYSILTNNPTFVRLYHKISFPTIYYLFEFETIKVDEAFISLLSELENNFCGEFFDGCEKPIQFSPQIMMRNNIPINLSSSTNFTNNIALISEIGRDVLNNFIELSIYYSSYSSIDGFERAFYQYYYPINLKPIPRLPIFEKVFDFDYPSLAKLNLILGDLSDSDIPYIQKWISYFASIHLEINLYVVDKIYIDLPSSFLLLFSNIYVWFNLFSCLNPLDRKVLCQKNYVLIYNLEMLDQANRVLDIDEIYPLYNGDNIEFLKSCLSYDKDEILKSQFLDHTIFKNTYLNANFFGELSILPNGDVYSCKNKPSLGNIFETSVKELLKKEFCHTRNWFIVRKEMQFCKDCVFNCLCPPLTSNELDMHYWTFCCNNLLS